MKFKTNKVLCVGEVLWDMLPGGAKPGGAPMNVAIHLKRYGIDVSLASRIGNDVLGRNLKDFFEASGLSSKNIQTDTILPTSKVLVHIDANYNASYEICEPVAWDNLLINDSIKTKAAEAGIIIFGTLASRNEQSRKTILTLLESDALRLLDVNLRPPYDKREIVEPLLGKADIVKLNGDELEVIARWNNKQGQDEKSLINWLAEEYNFRMVVVTRGENGAIVYNQGEFYNHPGFKVKALDTVGSGDAFLAAFIASLLKGKSTNESLQFACACGAFIATQSGGTPDYSLDDINQIISRDDELQ